MKGLAEDGVTIIDIPLNPPPKETPKSDPKPEDKKDPEEEEEKENDDKGGAAPADQEGKKPEPKSEPKPGDDDKDGEQVDSFLSKHFGEKYSIKTRKELEETLESVDSLLEEHGTMKKKLEEVGDGKPKFATDRHEKAFNFIKDIDPDKWGENMETLGMLWGMNVDEEKDSRKLLEEQFVLQHPELNRTEAQFKFNKKFAKEFGEINKEDFKDEAEYEEELKSRKIDLKSADAKARKFLKEKQEEFKVKPEDKTKGKEPEINPEVKKAIDQNSKEFEKELGKTSELVFQPTDEEEDEFVHKFDDKQLEAIRAVSQNWVKNPTSYGKDGKLLGGTTPEALFKRVAYSLYGDDIITKNYEHAQKIFAVKRAEELSGKKPTRTGKVQGASAVVPTEEEQIQAQIDAKKGKKKP